MSKPRRINCRAVHTEKKLGMIIRPDHAHADRWFIGMPGAAAIFTEAELIQLANSIADLLEEVPRG